MMRSAVKDAILAHIRARLSEEWHALRRSAMDAHAAATHPDAKAENKYDTRGLEASYLAGAQKERSLLLESQLQLVDQTSLAQALPEAMVATGTLVEAESEDGTLALFFVFPVGGGYEMPWEDSHVKVITPQSPLGEALLGKSAGDEAKVRTPQGMKNFLINRVL